MRQNGCCAAGGRASGRRRGVGGGGAGEMKRWRAEFGVRNITSVANEVRQILWPDGDDAISAIDAIHGE